MGRPPQGGDPAFRFTQNEVEDKVLEQLQQTVDSDPNNPESHYNLGLFLWKKGEESKGEEESKRLKEKGAESFLASAKLNPSDYRPFVSLGHFYKHVTGDSQRAAKCYQRAVTLNPDDSNAGDGLCDLLDEEGKESLEIAICKESSRKSPRAFWAFRRLGFFQVHERKWLEAVPNLQHAIRGFPSCSDSWEALGLAYHRLGMFTAALKSYERAIEVGESRTFALIESGDILILLGSFRQGVEQFRKALEFTPKNLCAQFGLACGLLSWAKDRIRSGAFNWAATLLQEAWDAAKSCTDIQGNLYSLWKLRGDIQIWYAKWLPWDGEEEEISNKEERRERFRCSVIEWRNKCMIAAKDANKSYQRALHLSPWQSNIYTDISISLHLIHSISLSLQTTPQIPSWQVAEKMAVGGLLLEPCNKEFWVILGCNSDDVALKQHCLIRALQLDVSLAEAWAFLGKTYRELGEILLARKALDCARSIDPSLALPWAGLALDNQASEGVNSLEESFDNCSMAVQILPIAEFQVGLGAISARSGHLLSPQVLGAIRQAVQRVPNHAESHNIKGLICEARGDYRSAIASYRHAQFALSMNSHSDDSFSSHFTFVSINLARSLCKAGLAEEASRECELLKAQGVLGAEDLQIYAVALYKEKRYEEALSVAKTLAGNISRMNDQSNANANAIAAVSLVSKLVYSISGKDSLTLLIYKIPSHLLQSQQMRFIISALNALKPPIKKLQLNSGIAELYDEEMHSIVALGNLLQMSSENKNMEIEEGVKHLKKALHLYPYSNLIRNQISSLLVSCGDWIAVNKAVKCTALLIRESSSSFNQIRALKSVEQIRGASLVACYASSPALDKFCFPSCNPHFDQNRDIYHLNRWMHQEPWTRNARYLFVLSLVQKAREENYANETCTTLKRLITNSWIFAYRKDDNNNNSLQSKSDRESKIFEYQKFMVLLCASEISLHLNDHVSSISYSLEALKLPEQNTDSFFAHLQLCRVYGIQNKLSELNLEYNKCLQKETSNEFGWALLKYIGSRFNLERASDLDLIIDSKIRRASSQGKSINNWVSLYYLACAQCFVWEEDYTSAELALSQACTEDSYGDACLLLCHGAICLEVARREKEAEFIWRAASSLRKAQQNSVMHLPFISYLLAKAEASLGSKPKWEKNLHLEFSSWPPQTRPAEIYFQMHLVEREAAKSEHVKLELVKRRPEQWLRRAIHLDPSCMRYWHVLFNP